MGRAKVAIVWGSGAGGTFTISIAAASEGAAGACMPIGEFGTKKVFWCFKGNLKEHNATFTAIRDALQAAMTEDPHTMEQYLSTDRQKVFIHIDDDLAGSISGCSLGLGVFAAALCVPPEHYVFTGWTSVGWGPKVRPTTEPIDKFPVKAAYCLSAGLTLVAPLENVMQEPHLVDQWKQQGVLFFHPPELPPVRACIIAVEDIKDMMRLIELFRRK